MTHRYDRLVKIGRKTADLTVGYFGASTGAAAALKAAAELGDLIGAVVSREGRPDMVSPMLSSVISPTLLVVGRLDPEVIELNERALAEMRAQREIHIIDGAGHLFEEEGKLEEVARQAVEWFDRYVITKQSE
jgi:putative phosphoribosyl transferase